MAWTYILECVDGNYYVGSTIDLEARVWQHNHDPDGPIYTRRRRPVRLVWAADYDSVEQAFLYEKQIQGWNRAKREALIRADFEALPDLSRRKAVQDREVEDDEAEAARWLTVVEVRGASATSLETTTTHHLGFEARCARTSTSGGGRLRQALEFARVGAWSVGSPSST
jgi:predicted GIY-YIG superfamily endonuclease